MARSCRKLMLLLAAGLVGSAAAAPTPPPALQPGQQPINLDAASTEVDGRTNTLVFSDVVISQGATRVQADRAHATGLNFANSRWTFDGTDQRVHITIAPRVKPPPPDAGKGDPAKPHSTAQP